jgi:hypothetical protein
MAYCTEIPSEELAKVDGTWQATHMERALVDIWTDCSAMNFMEKKSTCMILRERHIFSMCSGRERQHDDLT